MNLICSGKNTFVVGKEQKIEQERFSIKEQTTFFTFPEGILFCDLESYVYVFESLGKFAFYTTSLYLDD